MLSMVRNEAYDKNASPLIIKAAQKCILDESHGTVYTVFRFDNLLTHKLQLINMVD